MGRRLLLSFIVTAFFVLGCDSATPVEEDEPADLFQVHLLSDFDADVVVLELDDRELFRGRVSSDAFFGLAAVVSDEVSIGEHRLTVSVHGSVREEVNFTITDTLVVIVNYVPTTQELHFAFLEEEPLYL